MSAEDKAKALAEARIKDSRCPVCGKPVFHPTDGGLGGTCKGHIGKIRQHANEASAVPEGWLKMSFVCRSLEAKGFKTAAIVKACGGDATTDQVLDEVFRPTYVGKRKYLHPDVLVKGPALLKKAQEAKPVSKPAEKGDKPASGGTDTANALKAVVKGK
jgi:hypothetical protein